MGDPKPIKARKPRRAQLIPGAAVFFGMVLYLNIRKDTPMEMVDYIVVIAGAIFFSLALYWYFKFRKVK